MTFDDGRLELYEVVNVASAGEMPVKGLRYLATYAFHSETLGIQRYYEGLKAGEQIDRVISIYRADVELDYIVVVESGEQFRVRMIQNAADENGIKITRLTLVRDGEEYEVVE